MTQEEKAKPTNALIHESSPYLLQHANNPVNWQPWNKKTLNRAKELDKPLLISIGYSTCHWCHVMAEESFEDSEVAQLMNENFVCIKVDREERPDVDQLYMDAVQMMTGAGGWPLNCFALPDGTPFFGGTYFRKNEWIDVLRRIGDLHRNNPEALADYSREVMDALHQNNTRFLTSNTSISKKDVDLLRDKLLEAGDKTNGGLKGAPKFPLPSVLITEIELAQYLNNQALRQHLELTLVNMARGGIYDHVGGGFARYSVDEQWKVPHFEKMLYDNAQLLSAYAKAYQINQNTTYKNVVEETMSFLSEELESKKGGYYSALDADSDGEEGAFYVWTSQEMDKALGPYSSLVKKYYNVKETGNWEGNRNILFCTENKSSFARKENLSQTELESLLKSARKKLYNMRNKRTRPGLDNKIIASWNALLLEGFLHAYTAFNEEKYLEKARLLAHYLEQNHLTEDGNVIRLIKKDGEKLSGFLDDYANLGNAFLLFYNITGAERYFEYAKTITEQSFRLFFDNESGLFFYSENDDELPQKQKDIHDNVMPSSNAAMIKLMHSIGMLTYNRHYLDTAQKAVASVLPGISQSVVAYSAWSRLLSRLYFGSYILAVAGPDAHAKMKELHSQLIPNAIVAGTDKPSDIPFLQNRYSDKTTRIFVCDEKSCLAPVTETKKALELIKRKPEQ